MEKDDPALPLKLFNSFIKFFFIAFTNMMIADPALILRAFYWYRVSINSLYGDLLLEIIPYNKCSKVWRIEILKKIIVISINVII